MSYSIAVTGVGAVVGHGVVKSIKNSDKYGSSSIIGLDINPDSIGFLQCEKKYISKRVTSDEYISSLLDILKKEKVDVFIPLIEEEFLIVHDNIHSFEEAGIRVLIQPREIIEKFLDKYITSISLNSCGVSTPETYLFKPENYDRILAMADVHGYPLFAKPRKGRSSKGLLLIKSKKHLDAHLDLLKDENYVIQEYLDGDDQEYTCTVFKTPHMDEPYFIALKRQLLNGTTVSAEVTFDETISDLCRDIGNMLPLEGSINVQLRKKDGKPYVFEINPRYSSTVFIRALCGFNDVEMGLDYILDRQSGTTPRIEKCKVVRYWEEVCMKCS